MKLLIFLTFSSLAVSVLSAPQDDGSSTPTTEQLKAKANEILDRIVEATKDSWFPPLRYLNELRTLMRQVQGLGLNLEDVVGDKVRQLGGHSKEYVCKIMNTIFNLSGSNLCN